MPRHNDLDTVAPDDVITPPTTPASIVPEEVPTSYEAQIHQIVGQTKNPFSSTLIEPNKFSFCERNQTEKILLAIRSHWFTNVGWVIITLVMLLVPSLLHFVPLLSGFPPAYQFIAVIFWYLVTFAYAFEKFLSWYFDVFIITTERVVDIDFENLLDKKFSEAGISKIQDVSSHIVGVSQTILNYGDVLIQTASEVNEIEFEKVPNPDKVIRVLDILRHQEELKVHV